MTGLLWCCSSEQTGQYHFNLCHDVYIGNIYIVPEGSMYLCDGEFFILESEIA